MKSNLLIFPFLIIVLVSSRRTALPSPRGASYPLALISLVRLAPEADSLTPRSVPRDAGMAMLAPTGREGESPGQKVGVRKQLREGPGYSGQGATVTAGAAKGWPEST